eukprot:PLAT13993.2.p2 GENE.PLAT13993.2~~PLAT13993.2.p2  ORF type:complete len:536 (-),score=296.99 PLAT13993.2:90-1697(-)
MSPTAISTLSTMPGKKRRRKQLSAKQEAALRADVFGEGVAWHDDGGKTDGSDGSEAGGRQTEGMPASKRRKRGSKGGGRTLKAAWHDEGDAAVTVHLHSSRERSGMRESKEDEKISGLEYTERLRRKFEAAYGESSWAALPSERAAAGAADGSDSDSDGMGGDSDDEGDGEEAKAAGGRGGRGGGEEEDGTQLLRSSGKLLDSGRSGALRSRLLRIKRVKDGNAGGRSDAVVRSVSFHPNGQLLMTAGMDKTVSLFQIDGTKNLRVQSMFLPDMPIMRAAFTSDGSHVVAAGLRPFFYSLDLQASRVSRVSSIVGWRAKLSNLSRFRLSPDDRSMAVCADDGQLLMLSRRSNALQYNFKMNGSARALTFTPDSRYLLSAGSESNVYRWDLRMRRCVSRFRDDGMAGVSTLAVSPDASLLAVGSRAGVVNVYDCEQAFSSRTPKPKKALLNLHTTIDTLQFNCDSQLLLMASHSRRQQVRIAHMPSLTVFSNFPTSKDYQLRYVSSAAWSPGGGYLAMGNDRGHALLYRVGHYTKA